MPEPRKVAYTNQQIIDAATGRWGEEADSVRMAEPVVITGPNKKDQLTIQPLTRRRRKKLKAAQAAYMLVGAQLATAQNEADVDQSIITKIEQLLEDAEKAYDEALFGDQYQQVIDFFDDIDEVWWDTMYKLVHDQLVNRVQLPDDVCPKCGKTLVEEGEEGKDGSSSTSSTDTGTKSSETSATT